MAGYVQKRPVIGGFLSTCGVIGAASVLHYLDGVLCAPTQAGTQQAWVTLALMAASIAASAYGAKKSSDANKKAKGYTEAGKAQEDALLRRQKNEAYADTAAGQRLLTQAKEFNRENWKKAQGAAKVGGGTDASVAQAKEAGNKMMANTLSNMAANDTERQDKATYAQLESDRRFANAMAGYEQARGQNIAQAASQASNAMMSAAGSLNSGSALNANTGALSPISEDARLRMMLNSGVKG